MIVDTIVGFILGVLGPVLDLLPTGSGTDPFGSADGIVTTLAKIDSVIPIGPQIAFAVAFLAFLGPMILFRLILFARHVLLP